MAFTLNEWAQEYLKTTPIFKMKLFLVIVLFTLFSSFIWFGPGENIGKYVSIDKEFRPRRLCNCNDYNSDYEIGTVRSTCSHEVSEAGSIQNVVSHSYFNGKHKNRNYTLDIQENLENIREFYPSWSMRVYTDMPLTKVLCNLVCENEDLYICPIQYADALGIGVVSKAFPMQFRFLPIGDRTVHKFLVRDLDSRITKREVDAVNEWQHSTKIFHAMRDNPSHYTPILGGMWGGDNLLLGSDAAESLQQKIVMNREIRCCGIDQAALEIHIYPFWLRHQLIIHDSYLCGRFNDSVPFPTQRKSLNDFVGRPVDEKFSNISDFVGHPVDDKVSNISVKSCPVECRPSYGQDWLYC